MADIRDIVDRLAQVKIEESPFKLLESNHTSVSQYFKSLSKREILEFLHQRNDEGCSLLHVAVSFGHSEVVKILVRADTTKEVINEKDEKGRAPIHFASKYGYIDIVEFLVANGADVNLANFCGRTALHYAVTNGQENIAELLIGLGANVNAQDKDGYTPLHCASDAIAYLGLRELFSNAGAMIDDLDDENEDQEESTMADKTNTDDKPDQVNAEEDPFKALESHQTWEVACYFKSFSKQQILQILRLRNEKGRPLLHVAASFGHAEVSSHSFLD